MMNTINKWELSLSGASWLLNEQDNLSALLSTHSGNEDENRAYSSRREMASQLLEELERSQTSYNDAPNSGWLDEKVELGLFDEIGEDASATSFVVDQSHGVLTSPASPIFSPASPVLLSNLSSQQKDVKLEEFVFVPSEDKQILNTFEDLFAQIQQDDNETTKHGQEVSDAATFMDSTPPESPMDQDCNDSSSDNDISALLESLIQENNISEDLDETALLNDVLEFIVPVPEESVKPSTSVRRRSARAKAQPYQVPDKLEPAPSGVGAASPKQERKLGTSGRGRRPKLAVEDRKSRKKEQNKTAATRYRLKKKAEVEELLTTEQELEARNKALRKQHDEIAHEISYLKKLMKEIGILA